MTDDPKDGGPAFPQFDDTDRRDRGMSLRDWFAGQVMAGMFASPDGAIASEVMPKDVARAAYVVADAMLAAREGKG